MEPEVISYIKAASKFGLSDFEIKQNLLNEGWEAQVIEESLAHAKAQETRPLGNKDEDMEFPPAVHISEPLSRRPVAVRSGSVAVSISNVEEAIAPQKRKIFLFNSKVWAIAVSLAILGAGAYGYYAYVYSSPQKVWQKFLSASQDKIYQTSFALKYSDQLEENGETKPFEFSVASQSYINSQKPEQVQSDNQVIIGFAAGDTEFKQEVKILADGDDLYLNLGDFLGLSGLSPDGSSPSAAWVKVNAKKLQEGSGIGGSEYSQIADELANLQTDFKKDLGQIWELSEFIKLDGFVGKEEVSGVQTLHFKNRLDKQALKLAVGRTIKSLQNFLSKTPQQTNQQNSFQLEDFFDKLIDKIEIKRFETWVGATDAKLYRMELVSSAPSFNGLSNNQDVTALVPGVGSARAKARDAKRLADVRQLATTLELYFNDKGGYPAATQGVPDGLEHYFITESPKSPTPADGNCSQYYNTYWYEGKGQPFVANGVTFYRDYELTFCLGGDTGGYKAGIAKLTPKGIESGIACPGSVTDCTGGETSLVPGAHVQQLIEGIGFGAELSLSLNYSNYGQTRNIEFPKDALDLSQVLDDARFKSRDAQRLADVRMLASALELYFNDFSRYPNSLQELAPTYFSVLPSAPEPADGPCSAADNQYAYRLLNPQEYSLSFCLGAEAGLYKAGTHALSPSGIE